MAKRIPVVLSHLHSNMVRFKFEVLGDEKEFKANLHSNMVRFKVSELDTAYHAGNIYIPIWFDLK